jgi:hypothetical protein
LAGHEDAPLQGRQAPGSAVVPVRLW